MSTLTTYPWPSVMPRSDVYTLRINGEPVDVLQTSVGAFALFAIDGPARVELEVPHALANAPESPSVTVHPLRANITTTVDHNLIRFDVDGPCQRFIDVPGHDDFFLLAKTPQRNIPELDADNVTYFAPGQTYEIDVYKPKAGETIYIAGGAVLRGSICGVNADNVTVCGHGIIDNRPLTRASGRASNAWLAACSSGCELHDVTFIESQTWTAKVTGSNNCHIKNINILADLNASDGIDICGSEDVSVTGCFVRAGDDCFAVKSVEYGHQAIGVEPEEVCKNVNNIRFEHCIAYSWRGGSALEMGHEFRCETVSNITWKHIDIIAVHEYGSAFSIRNCDGATIDNVLWEDIHVEHYYNELIGFKLMRSRYSRSDEPGHCNNVVFKDIKIHVSEFNGGYSVSHIGGYDNEHRFDGIVFDNFVYGDKKITSLDDFDCYSKYVANVTFR